jgi:hypothetical protein
MFKKIQNILKNNQLMRLMPLCAIIFATTITPMEPQHSKTKKLAAKSSAIKKSQQLKKEQESASSCEECDVEKSDSECSYDNPLGYLFEKAQPFSLAEYNNRSGSVLPVYKSPKGKLYVVLTREAHGKDRRKYDDFSGGREKTDKHPQIASAREFTEEAILNKTLKWSLEDTIQFLDPDNDTTIAVIAYSKDKNPQRQNSRDVRNVTYIVDFDQYAKILFKNFYTALAEEKAKKHRSTTEKDRIAGVLFEDLKEAIINKEDRKPVRVSAKVLDPKTNSFREEQITLRPFLTEKLHSYFLNMPYNEGEHTKIRHYRVHRQ